MKNIIIAYISTLGKYSDEIEYKADKKFCGTDVIRGIQTNEAGIKCILGHLNMKKEKADAIICLVSEKVLCAKYNVGGKENVTTYDFFKSRITEYCAENLDYELLADRFIAIETEGRTSGDIICEIEKAVRTSPCNIFLDTTGGRRDSVMTVELLTKFLEYSGIRPVSVYSDINGSEKTVKICDELYDNMKILDAVNEFAVSGRAMQLGNILEGTADKNKSVKKLLDSMRDFSDSLQMCSTEHIDEIIASLRTAVDEVEALPDNSSDDIKLVMLKMMLPIIKEKFFGQTDGTYDYCRMVKWCAENGLIQQALTIYTEMIPKYIYDRKIVEYSAEKTAEAEKKLLSFKGNLYAILFHDFFTDCVEPNEISEANELSDKLSLKYGKNNISVKCSGNIKKVMDALEVIRKESENKDFKVYINKIHQKKRRNPEEERVISEAYGKNTFESFINSLKNNHPACLRLLGYSSEKADTLTKKMYTAENLGKYDGSNFIINEETEKMKEVMYGYLYIKAVRNHVNHANAEEDLMEEHIAAFKKHGFSVKFDSSNVKKDIIKAISAFDLRKDDIL